MKDVFHDDRLAFEQRRDAIVARVRASAWYRGKAEWDDLRGTVEGLAEADDPEDFDYFWDELYDHADRDRVWIGTF